MRQRTHAAMNAAFDSPRLAVTSAHGTIAVMISLELCKKGLRAIASPNFQSDDRSIAAPAISSSPGFASKIKSDLDPSATATDSTPYYPTVRRLGRVSRSCLRPSGRCRLGNYSSGRGRSLPVGCRPAASSLLAGSSTTTPAATRFMLLNDATRRSPAAPVPAGR
jgi:hypothetical protein